MTTPEHGPSVALHVADIAGVASSLGRALEEHTCWRAEHVGVPMLGAGRGGLLHAVGKPVRALRIPSEISRAARRSNASIVHLHWARFAPLAATQLPLIVHAHGSDVRDRAGWSRQIVDRALRRAAAVLVSTPELLEHVPAGAEYLPNPVDTDRFRPPPSPDDPWAELMVLLFARLSAVKGAPALIDAAERIRRARPDVRIAAFAGGEYDDAARRAGVEVMPARSGEELVRTVQSASVVVGQQGLGILSLSELEALACGRPLVVPIRRDLYGPRVPVLSAKTPDEICAAVLGAIESPEDADRTGSAARGFVLEVHSFDSVGRRLSDIYGRVMSGG